MNLRPYWQYYKDLFPFIAGFAIVGSFATNLFWGFVIFCTMALFFGFLGFHVFKKKEYYFYYNLGLTKWKLFMASFVLNLLVGVPLYTILLTFFYFFFGGFTST
ncbi:hypothetical protein [Marixanthomonas spongiae]|uniref:Uncharacterized protein n=1 Tax=Marixanthomonas spongiae TaxID=2174845 RepID=A0A2U0HW14_9FLAO|nr:hypothetical protein [Marixanthomonas spongiae]PVW13061.1 hypothetical protein DDV96_14160 [Marixanthomonas spongiae]